jgi:hypothetical protein
LMLTLSESGSSYRQRSCGRKSARKRPASRMCVHQQPQLMNQFNSLSLC